MAYDLNDGEHVIDSWTLLYSPNGGGKVNGKLTVTNKRLLYEAKFDASALGILGNLAAKGHLEIEKRDIASVEAQKKLFSKKAIVKLIDGSTHVFDYGAMNIDKCVAAIEAR